jgi:hypothetical protein
VEKVMSVSVNRSVALALATVAGVAFGVYNTYWPPVDVGFSLSMLGWAGRVAAADGCCP